MQRTFLTAVLVSAIATVDATPIGVNAPPILREGATGTAAKPDSPAEAEFRKGAQHLVNGRLAQAEAAFVAAAKLDPKLAGPLVGLADIAMKQSGRPAAEKWLRKASEVAPNSPETQIGWGRFYLSGGDAAKAEKAFRAAIDLRPADAPAYIELGRLYIQRKEYDQAAVQFRKAAELRPTGASAWYGLGVALAASGKTGDAVAPLAEAARLAPKDPDPLQALARLYAEARQYDKALAAMDQAILHAPQSIVLRLDRADMIYAEGDVKGAQAEYRDLVRRDPKLAPAYFRLGEIQLRAGDLSGAEAAFVDTVKYDPEHVFALNNLAWIATEHKTNLDQALAWANRAVALSPNTPQFRDTLGWVYRARGDLVKARAELERAATASQNYGEPSYHLGIVLEEQGRRADAANAFARALKQPLGPDSAADAKKRLQALNAAR